MALRDLFGKKNVELGFTPLTAEHRKRQELFVEFWNYYRGRHRKALKVAAGQRDDNVTLNLSKRTVNKGVQFLFGKHVTFQIDEQAQERSPTEAYLDRVWGTEERKSTLLQEIAMNGAVTGTPVVRLYAPEPGVQDGLPRIVNIDPMLLDVVTAEDDVTDVRSYRLVWKSGKDSEAVWKRHRFDLLENGTWGIAEDEAKSGDNRWREVRADTWPYPFAPILTAQNLPLPNEFWGMSDLEDADINDAINFTASNISRILKFHAHPKTIGTGFSAAELQATAVDEFWTIPMEAAKVFNLEMQSDLASAYNYLQTLKTLYAKITGVPDLDPAQVNVGALSGFALRILYGDLMELTLVKRNTYGALLTEINERVLALGNQAAYGTVEVRNAWKDPLPEDALSDAQTLEIDVRNGLSQGSYLERRGYDAEREMERKQEEQEDAQARFGNVGDMMLREFGAGRGNGQNEFNPMGRRNGAQGNAVGNGG